jgi:hypothetical protein
MIIENAVIDSADIVFSRGFILDCWLYLSFDGAQQGFGGFGLGGSPFDDTAVCAEHHNQKNLAADFIGGVMAVAGVEKFSAMPGKVIRVEKEDKFGPISAIGHPIKDRWYRPTERFEMLVGKGAEHA